MVRQRVLSLGLGMAFWCTACRPAEPATSEPESVPLAVRPATPAPVGDANVEPRHDGSFVVALASHCAETWNAALVRGQPGEPLEGQTRFEVNAGTRELRLQPGDALVLTTPHGGIMALNFDNLTAGYGARVEVTSECSGVKRTVFRSPAASADL